MLTADIYNLEGELDHYRRMIIFLRDRIGKKYGKLSAHYDRMCEVKYRLDISNGIIRRMTREADEIDK